MWTGRGNHYSPLGVELAADALRVVQLARSGSGWRLQAAACAPRPAEPQAQAEALRRLLAGQPFRGRVAVAAMADKLVDAVPLRLSLEAGASLEAALLKEAANYLPYPLGEAVIDYCVFEDQRAEKGLLKTLVFAARREQVMSHLALLEAARLRPLALDATPFALRRLCLWGAPKRPGKALLVGLGSLYSTLVVLWDGRLFLQRIIAWGVESMAGALVSSLDLSPELARKTLQRFDFSPGAAGAAAGWETIAQVGSAELRQLVAEIERVLIYCASEMRGEVIDEIVLAGECQGVRGLVAFLERALGIPARITQPFAGLTGPWEEQLDAGLRGREAVLAVACGLALRGSLEADD